MSFEIINKIKKCKVEMRIETRAYLDKKDADIELDFGMTPAMIKKLMGKDKHYEIILREVIK